MLDVDRLIGDCHAALVRPSPPAEVRELLARAVTEPAAVERALGPPRRGGLFPLFRSAALTILNVVWAPGMAIPPHDHRMWAVLGLYGGREDNTFYRRGADGLRPAGGRQLVAGQSARLGEAMIHAVANPLRGFTGAIHVYGGDLFGVARSEWAPDGRTERPFDLARAQRAYAAATERWIGRVGAGR